MMKKELSIYIGILVAFVFISCGEKNFTIGNNFLDSEVSISSIDTFQVNLSTVLLDSMQTSGDTTILLGHYQDNVFGEVTANTVFQVGLPSESDLEDDDIYDSITLFLIPNGYIYGDTTSNYSFSVHQLEDVLELGEDDEYFYNTTELSFQEEKLGEYDSLIYPGILDTLQVRLSDELGYELFNMFLEDDPLLESNSLFSTYIKGIILTADTINTNYVLGFSVNEADLCICIHYHRVEETIKRLHLIFPVTSTDLQFNQIKYDFSSSNYQLTSIKSQREDVSASELNNLAFLQAGVGLFPRVEFPTLQEILYYNRGSILKAELILYPDKLNYSYFDLPEKLILFESDKYNRFVNPIYDSDGNIQVGTFYLDEFYHEDTYYAFDITDYIVDELSDGYFDSDNGLFLTMSTSTYLTTLERVILTSNDPAPMLKIYYVSY